MSGSEALFTAALGLSAPWRVTDIRFAPEAGEIHFDIGCESLRLSCPVCGATDQSIHDRRDHTWQHLHFFQYRAFIHAPLPRVGCAACGKTTQVAVPWARPGSGFTLLFEALVLTDAGGTGGPSARRERCPPVAERVNLFWTLTEELTHF